MVKIATWNINSVRLRMPLVERFLQQEAPDVLCLQEIKCQEAQFPHAAFEALGYVHRAVHGQKGYHGVATVSRIPLRELTRQDWQDNGEARHVGVELGRARLGRVVRRGGLARSPARLRDPDLPGDRRPPAPLHPLRQSLRRLVLDRRRRLARRWRGCMRPPSPCVPDRHPARRPRVVCPDWGRCERGAGAADRRRWQSSSCSS